MTFSPGDREPLIPKLLDLYRNDPDAGIHGSAEWVLRQWKQDDTLEAADAELSQLKDPGQRRWFVNSRRQTFAKIEGPVEFRMGSPENEPDRSYNETPDRRVITPPTMLQRTLLGASLKRGWTDPIHDADLLLVDLDLLHQSPNDLPSRVPVRLL